MKAIILIAGMGTRLGINHPKCLLTFGGKTLIQRHIEALNSFGIEDITTVVGYRKELIKANIVTYNIKYVENSKYDRGNAYSLYLARNELNDDVIIMHGDVLFAPKMLGELISADGNCMLVSEFSDDSGEEMNVWIANGIIAEMKRSAGDGSAEWVGFIKISKKDCKSLSEILETINMDTPLWHVLNPFLKSRPTKYVKTVLPWIEIDFPEDLVVARNQIYPAIEALESKDIKELQ